MRRIAYIVAVVGALIAAQPAFAGTASVSNGTLHFVPTTFTNLDVDLQLGSASIGDPDDGISAGAGCTQQGRTAICAGVTDAVIELPFLGGSVEIAPASSLPIRVVGSTGRDVVRDGGSGALDFEAGADGDELVARAGAGPASFTGGPGSDLVTYEARTAPLSISLDDVANDGQAGEGDNIHSDVEVVYGGRGDDVIAGGPGDEWLVVKGGDDTLEGLGGDDTLAGDGADNILDGGPGADTLRGGDGFDSVDYFFHDSDVHADLDGAVGDDGEAGEGDTIAADVEGLFGGPGDDTLTGNGGDNFIAGEAGDDVIAGGPGGADLLDGGEDDDQLDSTDGRGDDEVGCGDGYDEVRGDDGDQVGSDCEETGRRQPAPAGPVGEVTLGIGVLRPASPPYRPAFVPRDRRAPNASLSVDTRPRSRTLRAHGLPVGVACDEACKVTVRLDASPATVKALARRGVHAGGVLARAVLPAVVAGPRTLHLRLNATGRRALRRLPAGTYVLTARVTDAAANARSVKKTLRAR